MQRTSSTPAAALVAAASILTSACIPIPLMSGYESASRQNIPARVPGFIIKGETTRADVVLALGEPDRHADDDSWLLYSSGYRTGGLAIVAVGGGGALGVTEEKMRYRILTVRFDAAGAVTTTDLSERSCPEWSIAASAGPDAPPSPCFDVSGDSLVNADRVSVEAAGEHVVATYYPVVWWQGRKRPPDLKSFSKHEGQGEWAELVITDGALILMPYPGPAPGPEFIYRVIPIHETTRVPLANIRQAFSDSRYLVPFVTLMLADGSRCAIQVMSRTESSRYLWDHGRTKAAGALLQERVNAAQANSATVTSPH